MTLKTRVRNGHTELVPPAGGYLTHSGKPTLCECDWHDNHELGSHCPECGDCCPYGAVTQPALYVWRCSKGDRDDT